MTQADDQKRSYEYIKIGERRLSELEALFYTMSAEIIFSEEQAEAASSDLMFSKVRTADVHTIGVYKHIKDHTVESLKNRWDETVSPPGGTTTHARMARNNQIEPSKMAFACLAKKYKMDSALPDLHGEAMLIADSLYSSSCSSDGGKALDSVEAESDASAETGSSSYADFFNWIAPTINIDVNGYFHGWLHDSELRDLKDKLKKKADDTESIWESIKVNDAMKLKDSFIKFMESKRKDLRKKVIDKAKTCIPSAQSTSTAPNKSIDKFKPAELCVRVHTDFTDSTAAKREGCTEIVDENSGEAASPAHRAAYTLVIPAAVHNKGNNELTRDLKINGSQVERYDQEGKLISVDQRLPSSKPNQANSLKKLQHDINRLENASVSTIASDEDGPAELEKKSIVITRLTSLTPTNRWYGGELKWCFSLALKGLWDTGTMLISPFHRGLIGTAANYIDEQKNQQFKRAEQELDNIEAINLDRMGLSEDDRSDTKSEAEDSNNKKPVYFFQANINQQGIDISTATSGVELKARVHADMALIATLAESDPDHYQSLLEKANPQYKTYLQTIDADADADANAKAVKEISRLRQKQSVEAGDVSTDTTPKDEPRERLSQALAKLMSLKDNACLKPENMWLTAALAKSLQSCGAAGCKSAMDRYKDWMETVEVFQVYKNLTSEEIQCLPRFKKLHQELGKFIQSTPSCLSFSSPVGDLQRAVNAVQKDHTANSYLTNVMMDGKSTSKLGQTRIFEPLSIGIGLLNSLAVGGSYYLLAKSAPTVIATKIGFFAAPLVIGTLTVPFAPVICCLALIAFISGYRKTVNTNNTRPMSYKGDTTTRMAPPTKTS